MDDLTILVNTSDGFEDCWPPFFLLFARYWPDAAQARIVLNTETKTYRHPGLDIHCAQVAQGAGRRLTWSECLMRCLDQIDSPFILYLQEDFFLESPVRVDLIGRFVDDLRAGRADVVRLMECEGAGPWEATDDPLLWRVAQNASYRIALQAALWRRSTLRSHLRAHESPWQLEVFGSRRARRRLNEKVLCVNRDRLSGPGREVLPYFPTGVVKGQWDRRAVVELFARNGIEMDFSRRGFYVEGHAPRKRESIARRLADRVRSLV